MKKTIRIQKGQDPFLEVTPLAEYSRQRGWQVVKEVVTIALPVGTELEQLLKDVKEGKIQVFEPMKENQDE